MSDYQGLVTKWRKVSERSHASWLKEPDGSEFGIELQTNYRDLAMCADELAEVIARNVQPSPEPDKDVANLLTNICQILDVVKLEWAAKNCWSPWDQEQRGRATEYLRKHYAALEARPVQQPAQIIAAQQAEDEGLWCIPQTVMEAHLQKELRRLTEAVEGKTSAECLRELLLKSRVQQPATEPDKFVTWVREDISEVDWLRQKLNEEVKYSIAADKKIEKLKAALALRDVPQGPNNQEEFEKYAKQHRLDIRPSEWQQSDWTYADADVESHWQCWLAARQVPVGPAKEEK